MTIGALIRDARLARGWTQAELAKRAGLYPQIVQKFEQDSYQGKSRDPRLSTVNKMLEALEIPTVEDYVLSSCFPKM